MLLLQMASDAGLRLWLRQLKVCWKEKTTLWLSSAHIGPVAAAKLRLCTADATV
jgi:hypothetical protein